MEKEVFELIRSFEHAASKMERFDETVSGFGLILEKLHSHLDELIEMVRLEEIAELAEHSSQKITRLNENLDNLDNVRQATEQKLKLLSAKKDVEIFAGNRFAYTLCGGILYGKDIYTNENHQFEIPVHKLALTPLGVLALSAGTVFLVEDTRVCPLLESGVDDFAVNGNQMLFLREGKLYRYHLLLQKKQLVMEGIAKISLTLPPVAVLATTTENRDEIISIAAN